MQCKLTVRARAAAALPLLLVLAGCGGSEPSGPQLSCAEVHQKVRQVAPQLDRDDLDLRDLFAQRPLLGDRSSEKSEKYVQMCVRIRAFLQQYNEVQKLVRDNKDRCKEFDFSAFGIGAMALENSTVAGSAIEDGYCK
jgi:hypothetical protein